MGYESVWSQFARLNDLSESCISFYSASIRVSYDSRRAALPQYLTKNLFAAHTAGVPCNNDPRPPPPVIIITYYMRNQSTLYIKGTPPPVGLVRSDVRKYSQRSCFGEEVCDVMWIRLEGAATCQYWLDLTFEITFFVKRSTLSTVHLQWLKTSNSWPTKTLNEVATGHYRSQSPNKNSMSTTSVYVSWFPWQAEDLCCVLLGESPVSVCVLWSNLYPSNSGRGMVSSHIDLIPHIPGL